MGLYGPGGFHHIGFVCGSFSYNSMVIDSNLETEYRLFPPVTIFLDLFPCAGYFFNASD